MWIADGQTLTMCERDFGVKIPITINGVTLAQNDEIKIEFKRVKNTEAILVKTFANIAENTVELEFTAGESSLFPVGSYIYSIDWYQNGVFLCNIIPSAPFKVVDKA